MSIVDIVLAATPLALVVMGAILFIFGWVLGNARDLRPFHTVVLVTALAAFLSQLSLGVGFARAEGVRTPTAHLYTWSPVGDAGFSISLSFRADLLSYLFALPLTVLALLCVLYLLVRRPYAETQDDILPGRLYGLLFLAEGAGLAAFYSADLVFTYFWLEAVGLALYLLSGPGLRGASARPGSYRALGANFFAGMLVFAPILVMVSRNGGHSDYTELIPAVLDTTLFTLLVAGCLLKAAQFPFQAWISSFENLPGAIYALLTAGFVFPFAVYLPVRLQAIVGDSQDFFSAVSWLLLPLGSLTIFFTAVMAIRQSAPERLQSKIALLAAGQFGFVLLALGAGNLPAAFQQLISLLVGAPLLFLCADQLQIENALPPNPENRTNPKPLGRPALFRSLLAGSYAVGILNFAGLPLSPAYDARWQTLSTLLSNGNRFYFGLALAGLILALPGLIQGLLLFMNGPRRTEDARGQETLWTLAGPLLLAVLSVALGFYPGLANNWVSNTVSRVATGGATIMPANPALGWLGLIVVALMAVGLGIYWFNRQNLVTTPYNGGLLYGPQTEDKPQFARTGRSKMALKVVEKEEELPEGFEDEFFTGAFKKAAPKKAQTRPLPDPRLAAEDYFGPLNERLSEAYKLFDTGYIGGFWNSLLLRFLNRVRRVFEWSVERFYPALAAFILLIFIILLTR
ncbi:MAG TPA: proton-conducting transporter membrane subunit [Chloroflexia bacterium]|nr:proton-conducting transporter membrane subunit [Chloroflexia bacterium]